NPVTTGSVTFSYNGGVIGSAPLNSSGVATLTTSARWSLRHGRDPDGDFRFGQQHQQQSTSGLYQRTNRDDDCGLRTGFAPSSDCGFVQ
ncbi:MAG: Ig-like domain-containing protein, partial [Planctomycetota bacterium]